MSAPVELVVFDWDGTLMDSTGAIASAIRAAAVDLGLREPSQAEASAVIGLGLSDALHQCVPDLRADQIAAFTDRYRLHYMAVDPELQAFEGVEAMLTGLTASPVPAAVATGKSRSGLNRVLDAMAWRRHFISTRCADEGTPKPHPWMLNDLIEEIGVSPEKTLMIGDTTHDLGMARAAGVRAIGVTYGAHPHELLKTEPSICLVDSVAELTEVVGRETGIDFSGVYGDAR
ncbi:MAG: HAD-IA family hydrolase [Burkholderiaceae bacterium]